ncbi:hypothetical protein K2173_028123 [Erythroxylum novogranatense]|uniref:TORTIFOLIA1/SINE1-2 N-terminal domain-containing protein n=1 Tax=Erythroxylum novogranatense TaxID=1862640 RepID=A0AAV8U0Z6_9ROSI|nr:hypothetical protein K2173_028123 [Erythroxylum novogranatense]
MPTRSLRFSLELSPTSRAASAIATPQFAPNAWLRLRLASNITKTPFSAAFLKPLSESVFTEQEMSAQLGSALCLAAAIDAAPDPDPARLGKVLVPRLERLVKSDSYKAKSAALVVIGSVIRVGGVSGYGGMVGLVKCLVGFLSSEDWAARKAAAEALGRLAVVERDAMAEFKSGNLKAFENRKFDKVKAVREVMSQMIQAWKQVPDISDEASPPPRSVASSKEDANDGSYQPGSKAPRTAGSEAIHKNKRTYNRTTPPDSLSARKRVPLKSVEKKASSGILRKVDCKKNLDWKAEIAVPRAASVSCGDDSDVREGCDGGPERRITKPDLKRALFNKNYDDKMLKFVGSKSGSRVVPCHEERPESANAVSVGIENQDTNRKESEDLSLIRNQLVQIEKQQSSLLDILQKYIGGSQNGMHALETRVHGLELALDDISYNLAVSGGRMTDSQKTSCCLLPAADFLSSKFWRKTDGRFPLSRLSSSGATSSTAIRQRAGKNGSTRAETFNFERLRLQQQGRGGFIVNPLAEIHDD